MTTQLYETNENLGYGAIDSIVPTADYKPARGARVITAFLEDAQDMDALEAELNKIPLPRVNSGEPTSLGRMVAEPSE
jgi:hypothetical protein